MHIIDYILKNTHPKKTEHLKRTGERPLPDDPKGDNADLRHRVCTECGKVWEYVTRIRDTISKAGKLYKYDRSTVHYFEDMPTFKKIRETCPNCKEKLNECTTKA